MTTLTARRLFVSVVELADLSDRLGLDLPPGFSGPPAPHRRSDDDVHPSLAAGLVATCAPVVGVTVTALDTVSAALGLRGDLGGSLLRAGGSEVEVSAWPAVALGHELTRTVPELGASAQPARHLPLAELTAETLREPVVGRLQATVVAPPHIVGVVIWLATTSGWLSLEPAEVIDGRRWARLRPVQPQDLAAAVAPFVASALA